jgi:hypothetical protein
MAHAIGPHLMPRTTFLDSSPSGILNAPTWAVEGFAEWAEIGVAKNAADRSRFVKANRKRYGLRADLPPNEGFYSADSSRTSFHYQVAAMMFVAVEKVGGKAKAVRFYELVVTQPNFVDDTPMFLDPTLREAGVDPAKVWRQFNALTR